MEIDWTPRASIWRRISPTSHRFRPSPDEVHAIRPRPAEVEIALWNHGRSRGSVQNGRSTRDADRRGRFSDTVPMYGGRTGRLRGDGAPLSTLWVWLIGAPADDRLRDARDPDLVDPAAREASTSTGRGGGRVDPLLRRDPGAVETPRRPATVPRGDLHAEPHVGGRHRGHLRRDPAATSGSWRRRRSSGSRSSAGRCGSPASSRSTARARTRPGRRSTGSGSASGRGCRSSSSPRGRGPGTGSSGVQEGGVPRGDARPGSRSCRSGSPGPGPSSASSGPPRPPRAVDRPGRGSRPGGYSFAHRDELRREGPGRDRGSATRRINSAAVRRSPGRAAAAAHPGRRTNGGFHVDSALNEETVLDALRKVKYPGFSRDIVSFGFVKDLTVGGGNVSFRLVLPTASTEAADADPPECEAALRALAGSLGGHDRRRDRAGAGASPAPRPPGPRLLPETRFTVAVASGKGGVGKSTVVGEPRARARGSSATRSACSTATSTARRSR